MVRGDPWPTRLVSQRTPWDFISILETGEFGIFLEFSDRLKNKIAFPTTFPGCRPEIDLSTRPSNYRGRPQSPGIGDFGNATSVMKLDPGSTEENPTVSKTSTPAILWVMAEVCIFTALLGLAMIALSQRNRPTALLALCSRAASPRAGRSKAQMDRRRRSQGDFCLRKKQG